MAILILLIVFCTISARLFVFPDTGMPARADAIVVLGGSGDRLDLGMQLAIAYRWAGTVKAEVFQRGC